jgi:hypothetical protein
MPLDRTRAWGEVADDARPSPFGPSMCSRSLPVSAVVIAPMSLLLLAPVMETPDR